MAIDIRMPDITTEDTQEAVRQMRSYLYQLAQTLIWAFSTLENIPEDGTAETLEELQNKIPPITAAVGSLTANIAARKDGKGVTIGGAADAEGFRCKIPADFSGGMTIDGVPLEEYIRSIV